MFRSLTLLVLTLLSYSCSGVKIQQHNLACHTKNRAEIVQTATSLLTMYNFKISLADTVIGLIQAESEEQRDVWSGAVTKRVWQINIRPDLGPVTSKPGPGQESLSRPKSGKPMFVIATAKTITRTTNVFGATLATAEHYYDDDAHRDWEWYWGVRTGLESVCDSRVVIITRSMN
jgi:hypothetical protein